MTVGIVGVRDPSFNGGKLAATMTGTHTFTYRQKGPDAKSTGGLASSDRAQAIVMSPEGGGPGVGLLYIRNAFFDIGGVKLYAGADGTGVEVENVLQEAGVNPIVWYASCITPTYGSLKNLTVADPQASFAAVRVDCAQAYGNSITVENAGTAEGPATLLGGTTPASGTQNPLLSGQQGIVNGYLVGQTNAARRGFGPVASPFANLIISPGPYACKGGGRTCTPGSAPDGTINATYITATSLSSYNFYLNDKQPVVAGDIFICASWVKSLNPPGYQSNATTPLNCNFLGGTYNAWQVGQASATALSNGEWDWNWTAFKISYASASKEELVYGANLNSGRGVGVYAPIIVRIPSGTVADNEAIEFAQTMQTYRSDATPGQVSLLPGEQFKADSIQVGNGPTITSGLGPPKGAASQGSIYLRRDGPPGSILYIYEKDGWKAEF
jgi:hypothetical protein